MAKTAAPEDDLEGITELEKFDPDRVDGVLAPASGLPFLVIKAAQGGDMDADKTKDSMDGGDDDTRLVPGTDEDGEGVGGAKKEADDAAAADGASTEDAVADGVESAAKEAAPALDPDGMDAVRNASEGDREAYLSALKEHRASEPLGKGAATGTEYLQAQAAWRKWSAHGETEGLDGTAEGARRWLAKHGTGPLPPVEPAAEPVATDEPLVIGEAADEVLKAVMAAEAEVYKRDIDTAERKRLAAEGKALPNLSYPIANAGDLDNAARLARSGHGDVAGAKALIRRRAAELGVSNPLDDNNETKKDAGPDEAKVIDAEAFEAAEKAKADSDDAPKGKKCGTCNGSGKIRGGGMKCPACKGKGFMKPTKAEKATDAAIKAVEATVAEGLINDRLGKELIAQIQAEAAKAAGPGARPLPPEVLPVAPHREPDGTSTVEQLEPDAGLGTDPDQHMDKVPASVAAFSMKATYEVQRMHDATCAAYTADDVLAAYPALKSVADAVDADLFTKEAREALDAGDMTAVAAGAAMAKAAQQLAGMSPAAIADGHAFLHKSFADMYPSEHITPQMGIKPGSYQRPYLSAGHAAEDSGGWTVNVPPSTHTPEPQDYERGYLTAGHAAPSPADHGPNNPSPPDAGGREFYSTTEKDMAAAAMRSMHDHIAATYAGCCPMAPARTVLPPGMGATNTPETKMPHAQGGVATVKAAGDDMGGAPAPGGNRKIKGNKGAGKKKIAKMLEQALRNSQVDLLGPAEVEAIIATKLAAYAAEQNSQVAKMQEQLDELGSQPDPAMAPVRGQMARASTGAASPVEKRSLVDEATQNRAAAAAKDRADLIEYVAKQAESPDPNVRERARSFLDELAGANVPA